MDRFSLDGRVAVVTGAAQGIGKAIGLALGEAGAHVVFTDLDEQSALLDEAAGQLGSGGSAAVLDVTSAAAAADLVSAVVRSRGRIDILVNAAAWRRRGPAFEIAPEDWEKTLAVTLSGTFYAARAVAGAMEPGGRIINIASQLGLVADPGSAPYCAAKGGVINLTRALALEWAQSGITVNAVAPGPTDTPMFRSRIREEGESLADWADRVPIGRVADPEDCAAAVVYLASDAASMVTGHTLVVDGGWIAR